MDGAFNKTDADGEKTENENKAAISKDGRQRKAQNYIIFILLALVIVLSCVSVGFCVQIYKLWSERSAITDSSPVADSVISKKSAAAYGDKDTDTTVYSVAAASSQSAEAAQNGENGQQAADADAANTGDLVNINTATVEELTALSGIGEVKAQAIVDYRDENGWFSSPEELTNVSGIGEKTLEKIIDGITVG